MIGVLSFYMLTFFFWKKPLPHILSGVWLKIWLVVVCVTAKPWPPFYLDFRLFNSNFSPKFLFFS
jgi:hypothetical protein